MLEFYSLLLVLHNGLMADVVNDDGDDKNWAMDRLLQSTSQKTPGPILDNGFLLGLFLAFTLLHLEEQFALVLTKLFHRLIELPIVVQHLTHIIHLAGGDSFKDTNLWKYYLWTNALQKLYILYFSKRRLNQKAGYRHHCPSNEPHGRYCRDAVEWH